MSAPDLQAQKFRAPALRGEASPPPDRYPQRGDWSRAVDDVRSGLLQVRLWWLLGLTDLRQRYSRSRLGQFWITLSMAVFIGSIGLVNAGLFRADISEYVPHLATSFVVWGFLSGVVADSTQMFIQAAGFLRQQALPRTVFVMRVMVRNAVALGHNLIIVPFVFLIFGVLPGWAPLLALPGLMLALAFLFGLALALGVLSTRFRDCPLIVQNLMQIGFFISPVMWMPKQLPPDFAPLLVWNPFAVMMALVAEPLMGNVPTIETWLAGVIACALSLTLGGLLFARFRARLVYWL